jgi:hypothetical protein
VTKGVFVRCIWRSAWYVSRWEIPPVDKKLYKNDESLVGVAATLSDKYYQLIEK